MDGLTTDVRSDVEQVDARLAQEMSQAVRSLGGVSSIFMTVDRDSSAV
jgi:hypothetical protein